MSEKVTTIQLRAPERLRNEAFVSRGHVCGYCHGKGWFYGKPFERYPVREVCPDCGGSGELMAVVTVEWKPVEQRP